MIQKEKRPKEWWEENGGFFNQIYLEGDNSLEGYLDEHKDLMTRTEREIEGVIRLCNIKKGDRILDCPCGYGRHSIALARREFNVMGIDINKKFLKKAIFETKETGLPNLKFKIGDMRFLNFKNEFDAVINMFYSFGFFLSEKENFSTFKNFFNALIPQKKLLMQTHVTLPKILRGDYKTHETRHLKSGKKLEIFKNYNPQTKREEGRWILIDKNGQKIESTVFSVRIYTVKELKDLCAQVGFRDVKVFSGWKEEEYVENSPEIILVATK